MRLRRTGTCLVVAVVLMAGCTDKGSKSPDAGKQPATTPSTGADAGAPSYEGTVCLAVLTWARNVVRVANEFAGISRPLTDAGERRRAYLATFDRLSRLTADFADRVDAAPPPDNPDPKQGRAITDAVDAAVRQVARELVAARADAEALTDADYEFRGVHSGNLYVTSEKVRAIVLHALRDSADQHQYPALAGACGRQ